MPLGVPVDQTFCAGFVTTAIFKLLFGEFENLVSVGNKLRGITCTSFYRIKNEYCGKFLITVCLAIICLLVVNYKTASW
jgi:hypothetical protein